MKTDRRRSREFVLQGLYQWQLAQTEPAAIARQLADAKGFDKVDADYFISIVGRSFSDAEVEQVHATVLKAYRWQYIVSGVIEPRFHKVLFSLIDETQAARIQDALAPLTYAVPQQPATTLPMAA